MVTTQPRSRVLGALLVSAMCVGCGPNDAPEARENLQPNILLISLDTVRADHTSVYGYTRKTTPHLEKFAEQGVVFEQAYAPMSTTGPSHGALFTAEYPIALGMLKNGMRLDETFTTLAERLAGAGYQTAAFVSSYVLKGGYGFGQGFEHYDDTFDPATSRARINTKRAHELDGGFDRPGTLTTDAALDWLLHRDKSRPFFAFVHYFDAHAPYLPTADFEGLFPFDSNEPEPPDFIVRRYDQEIAYVDREIGRLLRSLHTTGLEKDTIVIVVADHGEGMFDHGAVPHGINIYEESVRVPLLMRWPGKIPSRTRIAQPVELLDVMPTLLGYAGVTDSDSVNPRDLGALIAGEAAPDPEHPVFLHRRHYTAGTKALNMTWVPDGEGSGKFHVLRSFPVAGQLFSLRKGPWKYIEGAVEQRQELYNLDADPGELDNVIASNVDRALGLATDLHDWLQENQAVQNPEDLVLRDEDREALEALGYVQ